MSEIERLQQLAGIVTERDAGDSENVKLAVGHVDNERDMVRRNLYQMGTYCVELYKMLGELPDSDFPHWWQSKIIKASTYLSDAKHYLENSLEVPPGEDMMVLVLVIYQLLIQMYLMMTLVVSVKPNLYFLPTH